MKLAAIVRHTTPPIVTCKPGTSANSVGVSCAIHALTPSSGDYTAIRGSEKN